VIDTFDFLKIKKKKRLMDIKMTIMRKRGSSRCRQSKERARRGECGIKHQIDFDWLQSDETLSLSLELANKRPDPTTKSDQRTYLMLLRITTLTILNVPSVALSLAIKPEKIGLPSA